MKTLEEIALQVAEGMPDGFLWTEGCGWEAGIIQSEVIDFARRLVAALGAQEPAFYTFVVNGTYRALYNSLPPDDAYDEGTLTPLYAASYIKEGWQMVPKEPTEAMLNACVNKKTSEKIKKLRHESIKADYLDLLAAAPEYGK